MEYKLIGTGLGYLTQSLCMITSCLCVCVCVVITYSKGLIIWSRETGSAVPLRASLLMSILRLNLVIPYGIPPDFRGGIHLFISAAIRHRVSPEFIGSRTRVPMAITAESPPAQGQ